MAKNSLILLWLLLVMKYQASLRQVKWKTSHCRTIQLKGGYLIWQKIQKRNSLKNLKKTKLFALQLDESIDIHNSILLTYVRYIDHDESDMKEDILSVSELPTNTTSSEILKVLSDFIEERGLEWKNCVGVCTDGAARLTGRNSGLITKIKDMADKNLLSTYWYIHGQNITSKKKMTPELNEVLSQSVKIINYIKTVL